MNCTDIVEISHERGEMSANRLLKEGWIYLSSAPGKEEDGTPYFLHALGKPKCICDKAT